MVTALFWNEVVHWNHWSDTLVSRETVISFWTFVLVPVKVKPPSSDVLRTMSLLQPPVFTPVPQGSPASLPLDPRGPAQENLL